MAITNAQQAKQIMNEGGPMKKIKGQDHMLAYITPSERDKLIDLGGQETMTPEGILAYPPEGNYGSEAKGIGSGPGKSGITGMASTGGANFSTGNNVGNVGSSTGPKGTGQVTGPVEYIGGNEFALNPKTKEAIEQKNFAISIANDKKRTEARERAIKKRTFLEKLGKLGTTDRNLDSNLEKVGAIDSQGFTIGGVKVPSSINALSEFTVDPSTNYFDEDSIREIGGVLSKSETGITKSQADTLGDIREDIQMRGRIQDPNDNVTQSEFEEYMNRNKIEDIGGDDGPQDPCKGPNPPAYCFIGANADENIEAQEEDEIVNYRLMADGGRAGFAEGGMPYEGGIMDLESSRQMYGLGKLVKKITRGVKKVAKSPIGKAALGFAAYKLGGGFLKNKGIMGSIFGQAGSRVGQPFVPFKEGFLTKLGLTKGGGSMMPTFLGGIAATTLGSYFMTPEEEEEQKLASYGADIDDPSYIMNNPSLYTNRRLAATGGSGDLESDPNYKGWVKVYETNPDAASMNENHKQYLNFYERNQTKQAEGSEEPVAKKTMPLLDMDGQEMDLREEGGFVPLGRMERADDVPARLSKNEFVFTADAVRNAGEGDVDKGAEVMYNMMKNLESGGDVSEESQGLEGAREMFQTSQRLEEVI